MPLPFGSIVFTPPLLCRLAAGWLILACASHAETDPWQAAQNLDFNAAAESLDGLHTSAPDDARVACAYASSLLVRDPVTAKNVTRARDLFEALLVRLPDSDTRYRPLALYLLGRIAHDHVEPARLDEARVRYEQLRLEYPHHPLADQAAVHLGFILALQPTPDDPAQAVTVVEALLKTVSTSASRRELHHLLAHLHWQVRGNAAAALPHYLAGRAIGFEAPYRNGEVDLTIAGLASEIGRHALAAEHYLAFAEANPRDARTQTARRLAAEALARHAAQP